MATHKTVTARTEHACKNCKTAIKPGTKYLSVENPFRFRTGRTRDVLGDPTVGAYCDVTCFEMKQAQQRW